MISFFFTNFCYCNGFYFKLTITLSLLYKTIVIKVLLNKIIGKVMICSVTCIL